MTRVAIIAAVAGELKPLVRGWARESRNGVDLWRRRRGDVEWIAAIAGIGVDAAARAFAEVEGAGPIDAVISAGWAGALSGDLVAGRAYLVSGVIDGRTGERFALPAWNGECLLVTSDRVADPAEKRRLAATYGAGLVDMEAAGVARLAGTRVIPFHCVKGISDGPGDRLPDLNAFITENGQFRLVRFILFSIVRPWHWPALARLSENSGKSALAISESVQSILDAPGSPGRKNGEAADIK
jgi:adenosylhomocysteine nucleosidase